MSVSVGRNRTDLHTYCGTKSRHRQLHVDKTHVLTESVQQNARIGRFEEGHWCRERRLDQDVVESNARRWAYYHQELTDIISSKSNSGKGSYNSIPPMDKTLTVDTKKYIPIKSGIRGVAVPVFHCSQSSAAVKSCGWTRGRLTRKIGSEDRNQNEDQSDEHWEGADRFSVVFPNAPVARLPFDCFGGVHSRHLALTSFKSPFHLFLHGVAWRGVI
jgi:hypothetical protein